MYNTEQSYKKWQEQRETANGIPLVSLISQNRMENWNSVGEASFHNASMEASSWIKGTMDTNINASGEVRNWLVLSITVFSALTKKILQIE